MKIILCIDNNNGMMFNNRRQSSDIEVIKKIIEITGKNTLFVNEYSYPLFQDYKNVICDNDFLKNDSVNDFLFIENASVKQLENEISQMIIFKWNRSYPHDFECDISFDNFILTKSEDIKGNSHEKITVEYYLKN